VIDNFINPAYDYREYSGFDPEYLNESQKKAARRVLLGPYEGPPCNNNPQLSELVSERIREIKEHCEEYNKHLIIFTAPKYIEDCPKQHQAMANFLREEGIEYYDFTEYFFDKNSLDYWRDRTHMLAEPSQIFTRHMVDSIPALRKRKENLQRLNP
jgi:hypothetical protein